MNLKYFSVLQSLNIHLPAETIEKADFIPSVFMLILKAL